MELDYLMSLIYITESVDVDVYECKRCRSSFVFGKKILQLFSNTELVSLLSQI
jgi:hypothetical protein